MATEVEGTYQNQRSDFPPLNPKQQEKFKEFVQHILSNAAIDYTSQEIRDIKGAVATMLERIKTRVNDRGIFSITRIVPSGSMAEQTSMWRKTSLDEETYLEFDFLAVLKQSIKQCETEAVQSKCEGCIEIVSPPVELQRMRQYYDREDGFSSETVKQKRVMGNLFLNEINYCLTSDCDCLILKCEIVFIGNTVEEFNISLRERSSSKENRSTCDMCSVETPTGTLSINTGIKIVPRSTGPNNCSLGFIWKSKAKSLTAPDKLLLQQPQPLHSLPIYVDCIPALEYRKPTSSGTGGEHDYFVVPKSCNVIHDGYDDDDDDEEEKKKKKKKKKKNSEDVLVHEDSFKWRKSWCLAELDAFKTGISDKHKRCYQVMKYLSAVLCPVSIDSYHIKTAVLQHHLTCSDTNLDCIECVMRSFRELLHAYNKKELLSYKSNLNILRESDFLLDNNMFKCEGLLNKICSLSETVTWSTFVLTPKDCVLR